MVENGRRKLLVLEPLGDSSGTQAPMLGAARVLLHEQTSATVFVCHHQLSTGRKTLERLERFGFGCRGFDVLAEQKTDRRHASQRSAHPKLVAGSSPELRGDAKSGRCSTEFGAMVELISMAFDEFCSLSSGF